MKLLVSAFFILVLGACGSSEEEPGQPDISNEAASSPKTLESSTVKTGAAVVFASNFAGTLSVGEMATVVISLTPNYPSGQLLVEITAQEGLQINGQTEFSEYFSGDYQFTQEIIVGSEQAGEYYLGVIATLITDTGTREARAFSETIGITDSTADLEGKINQVVEDISETIYQEETYLPALEEIIRQ